MSKCVYLYVFICACVYVGLYLTTCTHACGDQRVALAVINKMPSTLYFWNRVSQLPGTLQVGYADRPASPRDLPGSMPLALEWEYYNTSSSCLFSVLVQESAL